MASFSVDCNAPPLQDVPVCADPTKWWIIFARLYVTTFGVIARLDRATQYSRVLVI
jgi:hypothetical protein